MKLLHRREEHVQDLFSAARSALSELPNDTGRYTQFLSSIILQGFLALLEPEITVLAREKDKSIVEEAVKSATEQYKEISGRDVKAAVEASLDDEECVRQLSINGQNADVWKHFRSGGIKLMSGTRRITLDNTLDERLRLLEDRVRCVHCCQTFVPDLSRTDAA